MKIIYNLCVFGALIFVFGLLIIGNIVRLVYYIKCIRIKKCTDKQCRVKEYCPKYQESWTEEEREHLQRLIDKLDEI